MSLQTKEEGTLVSVLEVLMEKQKYQYYLSNGDIVDMDVDEAAELDSPEGTVVIHLSATYYKQLLELFI